MHGAKLTVGAHLLLWVFPLVVLLLVVGGQIRRALGRPS